MEQQEIRAVQLITAHLKCVFHIGDITLKMFPMSEFAKHRIEQAKERLRNKLTYEYIISIPKFKSYTREQYDKLITGIETLSLLLIESFINQNNNLNHE